MFFAPFFRVAMTAPGRQIAFRRAVVMHIFAVAALVGFVIQTPTPAIISAVAQILLVLGFVEGAAMIGWRLTQMPKSQALEFLLISPIQPKRVYLAEWLVGVGRFTLVQLAGLPVVTMLIFADIVETPDLLVLALMPFIWGVVAGLGLTAWVYEPVGVRRIGEMLGLLGVLFYLVIGVVAGENLRLWLNRMPESLGRFLFDSVMFLHTMNPFGIVRYWFASDRANSLAWQRFTNLHLFAAALGTLFLWRGASRLRGHFHDRHYKPLDSSRATQLERIGDKPLSWWAIRRVMEYSGRVNLWLAGGFSLVYAAFLMAGDDWPAWMGKLVFFMFETWGGAPMVATALVVLAAVPAAYQFGLWDASPQDRCQRLELLLLTDLSSWDYCHASLSASWKRGRGYLVGAAFLWVALAVSGRIAWYDAIAATLGAFAIWAFSFAVGFRGFSTGNQTNGIASVLTMGMPLALYGLYRYGGEWAATWVPTATTFLPLKTGISIAWLSGFLVTSLAAYCILRKGLRNCDNNLRSWYNANQGTKAAE